MAHRYKDIVKIFKKYGFWREVESKGSHVKFYHDDGRYVTLSRHRDVNRMIVRRLLKEIGAEEYRRF